MITKNSCPSLRRCKVVSDNKKYLGFGWQGAFLVFRYYSEFPLAVAIILAGVNTPVKERQSNSQSHQA
ncbi:hypothetical protein AU077_00145 [Streptococcus gallolyticus]|nr:hypothetical protein AU077_00145 [Streptococcus gallolyticus]SCA90644.1 hypothetical protein SMA679_2083 [Streptococcus macedonicus]